jgi:RNA polymerase sigma-70 factor (ECF subfamily)
MANDEPPKQRSAIRRSRLSPQERAEVLGQLVLRHTALSDAEAAQLDDVFADIYRAHEDAARQQLRRWRFGEALTKDLHQESMIDLYRSLLGHGFPDNLASFLRTIVMRKIFHFLRDTGRRADFVTLPSSSSEPVRSGPVSALERALDARALAEHLSSRLTPEQELLFDLLYREELSYAEANAKLGIPEGTVKSRALALRKALILLADEYEALSRKGES